MAFKKGHGKYGGIKKGDKQPKTIVKELLADRISEFDDKLFDLSNTFLSDPMTSGFAWKELLKYRLPQKKELSGELNNNLNISVSKFFE